MKDPIGLVETIYGLAGDEQQWVARLAEAFEPDLPGGPGIVAQTYDANGADRIRIRAITIRNMDPGLLAARPRVALSGSEESFIVPIMRTGFVETLRRSPAALRRTGMAAERAHEYERVLDSVLTQRGLADQFWLNAQDPTYFGCCFIVPSMARTRWQPREAARWRCIAAHVSAAFRIRRQLSPAAGEDVAPRLPEAIVNPDGRVQHATEPAKGRDARAALRRAVVALDKARGPMRKKEPERAMALWQALVAGRWSLLDHFDSDGRRYVVAHRNDAEVPDARGLTLRERQIAAQAALGHSNKIIAYALGLPIGTVAGHLASARAKLAGLERATSQM
jgi:DNA-binding CsgD family transcriptional regulator